jgi:hypothetical protein
MFYHLLVVIYLQFLDLCRHLRAVRLTAESQRHEGFVVGGHGMGGRATRRARPRLSRIRLRPRRYLSSSLNPYPPSPRGSRRAWMFPVFKRASIVFILVFPFVLV